MDRIADCYEMVESLFVYHYCPTAYPENVIKSHYLCDYVKALGENVVYKIIACVAKSIDHIECGVYTDSEDCSYNTVYYKPGSVWKIDLQPKG